MLKIEEIKHCNRCDATFEEPLTELLTQGPHYAKARCPFCKYTFGFLPKPENKEQLEKRPEKHTPEELDIKYCQLCLRHEEKLGKGWLCVHHMDDDPANNDRLNLMVVCIACHKLIAWLRTYTNDHFKE